MKIQLTNKLWDKVNDYQKTSLALIAPFKSYDGEVEITVGQKDDEILGDLVPNKFFVFTSLNKESHQTVQIEVNEKFYFDTHTFTVITSSKDTCEDLVISLAKELKECYLKGCIMLTPEMEKLFNKIIQYGENVDTTLLEKMVVVLDEYKNQLSKGIDKQHRPYLERVYLSKVLGLLFQSGLLGIIDDVRTIPIKDNEEKMSLEEKIALMILDKSKHFDHSKEQ